MDVLTHTLTGMTLWRAGLNRATPMALPMLLVSSVAADVDYLSALGGPSAYLHGNRTATHSLIGTAVIVAVVAGAFWLARRRHATAPVRLGPALTLCALGAGIHLLMDLGNPYGVKLFWPFSQTWVAWDIVDWIDVWIIVLFVMGLGIPILFRLITEEIGAKSKRGGAQRGAIVGLALVALWIGGRAILHDRAMAMMRARLFHQETPIALAAFPSSYTPLTWKGVVETENAIDVLDVPLAPGSVFDPLLSRPYFKPEDTPAIDAARKSKYVDEFLQFARFPKASVQKTENGFRFELRDMRFDTWIPGKQVPRVVVELNRQLQITDEKLYFGPSLVR